jgi:hypothetical protein
MDPNILTVVDPVSDPIQRYLDCINRPLDFHEDGRIPDGNPSNSIMFVDYLDDNPFETPVWANATQTTVAGVGITYSYGRNLLRNNCVDIPSGGDATDGAFWGPIYFFIDQNNFIIPWDGNVANSYYWSNPTSNIAQIVGSIDGYDQETALANQLRLLSAGIRMLPTIELVTDSSTFAVSRYYAGQLTPSTIDNAANFGLDFLAIMRASCSFNEYTNAEGVSARLNPHQEGIYKVTNFQTLGVVNDVTFTLDNFMFPTIVAQFTTTQIVTIGNSLTCPIRTTFRTYLEGILNLPTPLVTTKVPYRPMWREAVAAFSYNVIEFPLVVKGHTFKKILNTVFDALAQIDPRFNTVKMVYNKLPSLGKIQKGVRSVVRFVKAKPKQRRKQLRKAKNQVVRYAKKEITNQLIKNFDNLALDRANRVTRDITMSVKPQLPRAYDLD